MGKVISTRMKYVFGNWKMNGSLELVRALTGVLRSSREQYANVEVAICPPFTLLDAAHQVSLSGGLAVGAQDVSGESDGAFTGAVSARMLTEMGCEYCLVGHSESRRFGGVTSEDIVKKIKQLCSYGVRPVLCIGETRAERDSGDPEEIVSGQLAAVLESLPASMRESLIVAYEPVWAIGSGVDDVAEQVGQITEAIRGRIARDIPKPILLFGGSVSDGNIQEVANLPGVDGVLVGGASLKSDAFLAICKGLQSRAEKELSRRGTR